MSYTKYTISGADLVSLYGATSQTIGVGVGMHVLNNGALTGGDQALVTLPNGDKYHYSNNRPSVYRRKFGLLNEYFYTDSETISDLSPANGISFITYNETIWCLRGDWPNGSTTLFYSTDGISWTFVKTYTNTAATRQGIISSNNYLVFPIHGGGGGIGASGTIGQLISRDGGNSWAIEVVSSTAYMVEPAVIDFGGDLYWLIRNEDTTQLNPLYYSWENGSTLTLPSLGIVQQSSGSPPCLLNLSDCTLAQYSTGNGSNTTSFFKSESFSPRKSIHWHKIGDFYGEFTQAQDAYRYASLISLDSSHVKACVGEPDTGGNPAQEFTLLHTPRTGARLTFPNAYNSTISIYTPRTRISVKLWIRAIGTGADTTLYLRDSSDRIWGAFTFAGTPNSQIFTIDSGGTNYTNKDILVDQCYLFTMIPNLVTGALDFWINDLKVRAGTRSNGLATTPTKLNWNIPDDGTIIDIEEIVIAEVGSETP